MQLSARAQAVTYRTYCRPKDESADPRLETWEEVCERSVVVHHRHLWEKAGGVVNEAELQELKALQIDRKVTVSGRTLWMGGTEYGMERACSNFNCSFTRVSSVYSVVDAFWLLLNGSGVGFVPVPGTLHGFQQRIDNVEYIDSKRAADFKGKAKNFESKPTAKNKWTRRIRIGDSAAAWAKAVGKLINPPAGRVDKLILDFSEIRGPGRRLKGYGWICNGWKPLQNAFKKIVALLNKKAGELLDEIDILDLINHLGTVLSSRRSAEIAILDAHHERAYEFATAKKDFWLYDNAHRQQSNNSLVWWHRPSRAELRKMMQLIAASGGSEPGFVNGIAARRRAPWFVGMNPCAEILLSSCGFCNLVSIALPLFEGDFAKLLRGIYLAARANYRQTCVDLRDGVLTNEWHQTNEALRLCGVSLTGIAMCPWLTDYQIRRMRDAAVTGAYSMADELNLPRPKLVTTIKPEGTRSKISDVTEGVHTPLGQYIINSVNFPTVDPIVSLCRAAGYEVIPNPHDANNVLVKFPVNYKGCRFDDHNGMPINRESAVDQLNRYKRWNTLWSDHNTSNTISWDVSELDEIVDWLYYNWDDYIAVSFLFRNDPTKTAADLGYQYLPQQVVTPAEYDAYVKKLSPIDWSSMHGVFDDVGSDCASGVCPVK